MNEENKQEMVPIGHYGNRTRYAIGSAIMDVSGSDAGSPATKYQESRVIVQDFDEQLNTVHITIGKQDYE